MLLRKLDRAHFILRNWKTYPHQMNKLLLELYIIKKIVKTRCAHKNNSSDSTIIEAKPS